MANEPEEECALNSFRLFWNNVNGEDMFQKYLNKSSMDHKPYQFEGVKWCLNNELSVNAPYNVRGGFIADEMGLGKTILMIGLMYCNFLPHTLIILPQILISQWYEQIYRTTGHKALLYHGINKKNITFEQLNSACIVIASYGDITLPKNIINNEENPVIDQNNLTMLHKITWNRIIFDEAHHLRNKKTCRYKSAILLSSNIRWLVSGTPIQNDIEDFLNLCRFIRLPSVLILVHRKLAHYFILKRTKTQVGIEMPGLHIEKNIVKWGSQAEMLLSKELHTYLSFSKCEQNEDEQNIDDTEVPKKKGKSLIYLLRAKQSCVYPKLLTKHIDELRRTGILKNYNLYKEAFNYSSKLDAVVNMILQRKDNNCGKLIFCHFIDEIDEIATRLRNGGMNNVETFDGRTRNSKRYSILNEYNDALVIQIQTGCEGLNLQKYYSEIYFISPNWNPTVEDQAITRCYRIGQTKPVHVFYFEMCSFKYDNEEYDYIGHDINDEINDDIDEDVADDDTVILQYEDTIEEDTIEEDNKETITIDKHITNIQENKRMKADMIELKIY